MEWCVFNKCLFTPFKDITWREQISCVFVVMSCNDMRVATCCDTFGRNACAYNGNALGRIVFSMCRKNNSCFPHSCCSVSQSVSLLSRIFFLPELQKLIKSNKRNMEHLRIVKRQSTCSLLNNYCFQFTKWHMFCINVSGLCMKSLGGTRTKIFIFLKRKGLR